MAKVVLITGASSGIGKQMAETLLDNDYVVYGTSRQPEKYPNALVHLIPLDVRNEAQIAQCIQYVYEQEGKIDVLINNAGVGITGPLEEIPMAEIRNQFEVNFFGPIAVIKAVLPIMRAQKAGLIINITSIAGFVGLPYRAPYSASKGALGFISDALRLEIQEFGIEVCQIAPGDFATNIAAGRYHAPLQEQSDYYKTYHEVLHRINLHVNKGENPANLSKHLLSILQAKHKRAVYKIGSFLQQKTLAIKLILPSKLFENMLKKNQGIP